MNRVVVKQHAVDVGLIRSDWRNVFVTADGFEQYRLTNLARLDSLHRGRVGGVVAAHKADLQANPRTRDRPKSAMGIRASDGQRFLAKNVLAGACGSLDGFRVELVGRRDQNRIKFFALEHLFEAAKRLFDLEFLGSLPGSIGGDVGDGYQTGLRNKAADVLRVTPSHLSNPKHADSELRHVIPPSFSYRFDRRAAIALFAGRMIRIH